MVGCFINGSQYRNVLRFIPEAIGELADRILQVGLIFVAEDRGRLVGMLAGYAVDEPIGRTKMLEELAWWVDPEYRKGSVGYKMLRCWEEWARQAGLEAVKMIAPAESPGVGGFLERRGYRQIETTYILRLDHGLSHGPATRRSSRGVPPGTSRQGGQGGAGSGAGDPGAANAAGAGRGDQSSQHAAG